MLKPAIMILALLFSAAPAFAEDEPSIQQVYDAAEAGKFSEAQAMMDKVLREHPNSAKAHFVEAEILAKQGQLGKASDELNTAERLKPGLPFVKPEVAQALKNRISSTPAPAARAAQPVAAVPQAAPAAAINEWMPWILLLLGIGLVVFLIVYLLNRRNNNVMPAGGYPGGYRGNMPAPNMPPAGFGQNSGYGAGPVVGQPAAGGAGSGLMGSLATGAALGAGVAAGEALVHHFLDGDKDEAGEGYRHQAVSEAPQHDASPWTTADNNDSFSGNYDMGGNDFGIADASSWGDDDSGFADSGDRDDDWV